MMTRIQRDRLIYAGLLFGSAREFEENTPDLTPDERRRLRSAHTNAEKAIISYIQRMDPEPKKRINRALHSSTLQVVVDRDTFVASSERIVQDEDLFVLAGYAVADNCQMSEECEMDKRGKNYKKCPLYEVMDRMDLPPASDEKRKCPYKL